MTVYMQNGVKIPTDNARETWRALDEYLGNKLERPGDGRNVRIERAGYPTTTDGPIAVRLHDTRVITFHKSGRVDLRWNGWNTNITHNTINAYLPRPWFVSGTADTILARGWYDAPNSGAWHVRDTYSVVTIGPRGGVSCDALWSLVKYPNAHEAARVLRNARNRERAAERRRYEREARERAAAVLAAKLAAQAALLEAWNASETARQEIQQAATVENHARTIEAAYIEAAAIQQRIVFRENLPVASKAAPIYAWKYLDLRDGVIVSRHDRSPWVVGTWRDEQVIRPCVGLNASTTRAEAYGFVNGDVLALVEIAGRYHVGPNKITADCMRILAAWVRSTSAGDSEPQRYGYGSYGPWGVGTVPAADGGDSLTLRAPDHAADDYRGTEDTRVGIIPGI